jgi:hypothetical protein
MFDSITISFRTVHVSEEYLSALAQSKDMDEEIRMLKYLELLHGFYKRHLATIAPHKVDRIAANTLMI